MNVFPMSSRLFCLRSGVDMGNIIQYNKHSRMFSSDLSETDYDLILTILHMMSSLPWLTAVHNQNLKIIITV